MKIDIKEFKELTTIELYEILKVREEVFIVEQNCIYNDLDNKDLNAIHLMIKENSNIVAYLRIIEFSKSNNEISFGRVLVPKNARGKGYAKIVVKEALKFIENTWKEKKIIIEAQSYLEDFYKSFGFIVSSNEFMEDGIPHICMKK